MAVQMRFGGFLFMHRLLRTCTSRHRHLRPGDVLVNLPKSRSEIRSFSTGSVNETKTEGSDSSGLTPKLTSRQALLARKRRPLSPLERVSGLLPPDALSPEVMQLREQDQREAEAEEGPSIRASAARCTQEESGHPEEGTPTGDETPPDRDGADDRRPSDAVAKPATLPGESPIAFGEVVLAELRREQVEFRRMFTLQKGERQHSNVGFIRHDSVAGRPAGQIVRTNNGAPFLIRRPSLEEYVLYMKRAATITYPKDASIMLMMMDVTEGDSVLECGSGSGAMSLFLSRAVGSKGRVLSVEVREDHLKRATFNYKRWRMSWSLRHREKWPDNVQFHHADVCSAPALLGGRGFHAIALDLINPHLVLPTVTPHLHPGAVCAVYLTSITQVTELLESIRCVALPLLCERVVEVPVRNWLVIPALKKNRQYYTKKAPSLDVDCGEEEDDEEETEDKADEEASAADERPAFGSIPYIARPHHEQAGHTAFLVKLRKFVP